MDWTERRLTLHRIAARQAFGSLDRANELINKIGIEEAGKLTTREFMARVRAETEGEPRSTKPIYIVRS